MIASQPPADDDRPDQPYPSRLQFPPDPMETPDKQPAWVTMIGWAIALAIVALVVLGVIAAAKAVL